MIFPFYKTADFHFDFDKFGSYLQGLKNGSYLIEIKKRFSQRSLSQNSYYWGVILETISESTGHTPEELHEIFKRLFLPPQYVKYRGKEIKMSHTTTKLNKVDFGEYLNRIFAEAGELGIEIPEPNSDNLYQ